MYSFIKYYAGNGQRLGANGEMWDSLACGGNGKIKFKTQVQKPNLGHPPFGYTFARPERPLG
jgi:hypothetical protein